MANTRLKARGESTVQQNLTAPRGVSERTPLRPPVIQVGKPGVYAY